MNETQTPSSSASGWKSAVAFAALAVGVLHLLVLNLQPAAPVWQWTARHPPQLVVEQRLAAIDETYRDVSGGRNLSMVFDGFNARDPGDGLAMLLAYSRAVYALYPRQVFVGRGDAIINDEADLAAQSFVPDAAWLRGRDVAGIVVVRPGPEGLQLERRAVPTSNTSSPSSRTSTTSTTGTIGTTGNTSTTSTNARGT